MLSVHEAAYVHCCSLLFFKPQQACVKSFFSLCVCNDQGCTLLFFIQGFFRRGLWGQFAPAEISIAPAGIDITLFKGRLILIPGCIM